MQSDRERSLFFELFNGLPRQGPGDGSSTRRALRFVPELTSESRILDVGCGTGAQTLVVAANSRAHIVAIDNHVPYVNALNQKVEDANIEDRVVAYTADMQRLQFAKDSFDLIWCESAVFVMGVEAALSKWRRYLRQDGFVAFTEICWQKRNPPVECEEFWEIEYPALRHREELFSTIVSCRYELIGNFSLPSSAWWEGYYQPLQENVYLFRERYRHDQLAQDLCDQCQREIDIWHAYSEFYGYEFFIVRPE